VKNPLEDLQVTTWYKALAVVSAPAFLIALAAGRDSLMAIFGGAFLIAVGEWRYHTGKEISFRRTPAGVAKITDVPRKIHIDGILFQAAGVLTILFGIYHAYTSGAF
jgi:hypothetical protein